MDLHQCYARTSSKLLKSRFIQVKKQQLRLMHMRKGDEDDKTGLVTTMQEDLSKAHIIKKFPQPVESLEDRVVLES